MLSENSVVGWSWTPGRASVACERSEPWRELDRQLRSIEYLERRMRYGPQVAAERLRVAEALDALPAIEQALDRGELSYSAVRELTRIATRKTEDAWVAACRGKVLRQ